MNGPISFPTFFSDTLFHLWIKNCPNFSATFDLFFSWHILEVVSEFTHSFSLSSYNWILVTLLVATLCLFSSFCFTYQYQILVNALLLWHRIWRFLGCNVYSFWDFSLLNLWCVWCGYCYHYHYCIHLVWAWTHGCMCPGNFQNIVN